MTAIKAQLGPSTRNARYLFLHLEHRSVQLPHCEFGVAFETSWFSPSPRRKSISALIARDTPSACGARDGYVCGRPGMGTIGQPDIGTIGQVLAGQPSGG